MLRILGTIALLLSAAGPVHAAETIATLPEESWIRSLGDTHLVQTRDEQGYQLMTIEDGELLPLYEIEPSRNPFTADIGTMRHGEPAIVFSRCERGDCDLYLHPIAGAGVRKLRGANTAADERNPTLSAGRVAWVRKGDGGPPAVMVRKIGGTGRSRRVLVSPRRSMLRIQEIELEGRHLAVDLTYYIPSWEVGARDVRLVDLGTGRRRILSHGEAGNQGQDYKGLSFSAGWFGWHRSCWEHECDGMAYRYRLGDGVRHRAEIPNFAGFSLVGRGYLGVTAGERLDFDGCDPDAACAVVRERRVRWRRDPG